MWILRDKFMEIPLRTDYELRERGRFIAVQETINIIIIRYVYIYVVYNVFMSIAKSVYCVVAN